jgi:hypothetical protein
MLFELAHSGLSLKIRRKFIIHGEGDHLRVDKKRLAPRRSIITNDIYFNIVTDMLIILIERAVRLKG